MLPKIHKNGSSFKGIAQYVLHDKNAETTERVAWTETINLATRNPDTAWKVMSAVSMDQARLKREAGVPTQGRKSKKHVHHVTLSWHPEEAETLTREEQMRAVKWVLRKMEAHDRQVLVVAHNDEPQPHVHLIINRCSTVDGRLLDIPWNKRKASDFARLYEEERGKIYCHQRVINHAARQRGEYVKAKKDVPRHIYEAQKNVANDNTEKAALLTKYRQRAAAIAKSDRADRARHKGDWKTLESDRQSELKAMKLQMKANSTIAAQTIRDGYRPQWQKQYFDQQAELAAFNENEATLRGRMQNALQLVKWRQLLGSKFGEKTTLSKAFGLFSKEGDRRQALQRRFRAQDRALEKKQQADIDVTLSVAHKEAAKTLAASHLAYNAKRLDLIRTHQLERAKTKAEWRGMDRQQRREWKELAAKYPLSAQQQRKEELLKQFEAARSKRRGINY